MSISPGSPNRPSPQGSVPAQADSSRSKELLDLSPAARAFVARSEDEGPIPAERLLAIRQRVIDGTYESLAVLGAVAVKLQRSGALR